MERLSYIKSSRIFLKNKALSKMSILCVFSHRKFQNIFKYLTKCLFYGNSLLYKIFENIFKEQSINKDVSFMSFSHRKF